MKLCVKGFPNRLRNCREKRECTDTHFRIYISRDVRCLFEFSSEIYHNIYFSHLKLEYRVESRNFAGGQIFQYMMETFKYCGMLKIE